MRQNYQQALDFTIGEDERIFFKVTGTHTIHLTGNYVIPTDDGQTRLYEDEEDEQDDYDLSPDEDELDALEAEGEESDELDDMEDPRVMEVDTDEEAAAPKLITASGKGKNKRPAPTSDDEDEANLDDIMAKVLNANSTTTAVKEEPKKLTKAEKKALKKVKKNDGEAAAVAPEARKEAVTTNGEKKVQFAKNLEQGPTPSATPPTKGEKKTDSKPKAESGVKEVQGVVIDDRKVGSGPPAKKGNKVEMRYIGKLENGKVFDGKSQSGAASSSEKVRVDGAGADDSSRKKRTKKANRSGSNSALAK